MSRAVTHVAGLDVTWDGRYLRQRCAWCGAILLDVDLALIAAPEGQTPGYAAWAVGSLVTLAGAMVTSVTLGVDEAVPDTACFQRPIVHEVGPCDWDGESYCIEDECVERASHRRFLGAVGEDEVVEMVCCAHAETDWTTT